MRTVRCAVEELAPDGLRVLHRGKERTIPSARLTAVVLAATREPPDRTGHSLVRLRDGSEFWGEVLSLREGVLRLNAFHNAQLAVPWSDVIQLKVRSARMVFASDMEPVSVQQEPLVTYPWEYRRNRNVFGAPLRLDGREYENGLGMHAPCRVTYSIRGNYSCFAAVIGIDDATGGKGDCVFRILGDKRELFHVRVRGEDDPRSIRVDVSGCRRVTLIVEPGAELDLADDADWCEARFVQ
jgi:hypothetical protein